MMSLKTICLYILSLIQSNIGLCYGFVKNLRNRKSIVFALLVCCFFLYLMSSYLLPAHRHFHHSQIQAHRKTQSCLDPMFLKWSNLISESNAILKEIPGSSKENRFFPFTGNGEIGFSADKSGKLFILNKAESVEVPFVPVLETQIVEKNELERKAILLNLKDGVVYMVSSYLVNKQCVTIEERFFAHRKHSQLVTHEVVIKNSGVTPVTITFKLKDDGKNKFEMTKDKITDKQGETQYSLISSKIKPISKLFENLLISAAISYYQPTVHVPQKSRNKVTINSVFKYKLTEKEIVKSKIKRTKKSILLEDKKTVERLTQEAKEDLLEILQIKNEVLFKQHTDAWNQAWQVRSNISSENDPDTTTALHVNLIHYYMYTSMQYNMSYKEDTKVECSTEAPTAHNADLWVVPLSIKSFYTMKHKWIDFLTTSHCLVKDSDIHFLSIREYMTLSFVGLQYKRHHLQLALNPSNLHSNLSVHNIALDRFHSKDSLDIQILYNTRQSEHVLNVICSGKHNPKIYGCAVACEYIVELTTPPLTFAVHNTNPVTPIFYISTNKSHLEEIFASPFMRRAKVNGVKPHQVDLQVHHYKLSPKFWLAVIVLVVSFHVIIIKMIYNECRKERTGRRRGPYNN